MRLDKLYKSDRPDISVELFPPKTPEGKEHLFQVVRQLKEHDLAFFSMTYGAGGSTRDLTLDLCDQLKNQEEVETTCHLNIIGQSKEESQTNLERLKQIGVYNLLALRGDPPKDEPNFKPHPDGFSSSVELIEAAQKESWFSIAVTGFPEVHPEAKNRTADISYLKRKIDAGGSVVITQLFFDNAYFFEFLSEVNQAGITAPVIPGILPILSVEQVRRFAALCGASIPASVDQKLSRYENDEKGAIAYGIELATQMCEELVKAGVPGLHFYALNRAQSTETILSNLGLPKIKGN